MFDARDTQLPPTATPLAKALDILEERLFSLPVQMISKDPVTADVGMLDHLAWEYSVDVWDIDWSEGTKRKVIALADEIHRHKGTRHAVQRALEAFDVRMDLLEWWEESPEGTPGTFIVTVFNGETMAGDAEIVIDIPLMRALVSVVERAAPVSRGFYLRVHDDVQADVHVSPAFGDMMIDRAEILMERP